MVARLLSRHTGAAGGMLLAAALACAWSADGQAVTGVVLDAYAGTPVDGATVVLVGTLYAAAAGADGMFALGPLPAGSYDLEISRFGYDRARLRITVTPGRDTAVSILLVPVHRELTVPAAVGVRWHRSGVRQPIHKVLEAVPQMQLARRSLYDFAPVIRGLHTAQVAVDVDGALSIADSPFGPLLPAPLLPYDLEVVAGPYALTWAPGASGGIRVRTPLRDGVAARAGLASSPHRYDVSAALGHRGRVLASELTGSIGTAHAYRDRSGALHLVGMNSSAVRGRGRWRRRAAEVLGWAGYQGRTAHAGRGIRQVDAGLRFTKRVRSRSVQGVDLGATWQQRTLDGWPFPESGVFEEHSATAHARLHFSPAGHWRLLAGADAVRIRHAEKLLAMTGVFAYGTGESGRLQYSGAIRAQATFGDGLPGGVQLSLAGAAAIPITDRLELSAGVGSVAKPAGLYERYARRAPNAAMPFHMAVAGNNLLKPERLTQADIGMQAITARSTVLLRAFARRVRKQIGVMARPQYVNAHGTALGCEMSLAQALAGEFIQVSVDAAYLWQRLSLSRPLAPLTARVALAVRAPADLFMLELGVRGASPARFTVLGAPYRGAGYLVVDVHLEVPLPRKLSVALGLSNAGGTHYGLHASGPVRGSGLLEEPGRQWTLRLLRAL